MSSPAILDFPKLLAAIPAPSNGQGSAEGGTALPANPAGMDLRADRTPPSLYDQVRDARKTARSAEDNLTGTTDEANRPDWRKVLELGTQALGERTKDLEITGYLIEALPRVHGFAGLRDGLRLARELIEQFWDKLYPLPDDEGIVTRIEALGQVVRAEGRGSLTVPLSKLPLTEAAGPSGRLTLDHYQKAMELAKQTDPKAKQRSLDQGTVPMEVFRTVAAESSAPFYITLEADLMACLDELTKLGLGLDAKCGRDSPATSNLLSQLTLCLDVVRDVAKDKLPALAAPAKPETQDGTAKTGAKAMQSAESLDAVNDREDAFRVLGKIADFFKRTEPHSVVSYALEQIVRWGRMPLPDLLSELIPDENPRKNLFQRVGIRPAEAAKGDAKKKE